MQFQQRGLPLRLTRIEARIMWNLGTLAFGLMTLVNLAVLGMLFGALFRRTKAHH
jgi:uncharacterized membrane protein SpoIIM required for sporulation